MPCWMYAFIRERRFIYYALFALSLVATTWILKGYATLYEVIPDWLDELRLLLTTGNMLLMGLILSSLDMFRIWLPPRLRRTCRLILMVVAAVILAVWLLPLVWSVYITFGSYLLVTLLAASFCIYFLRRGTIARLYCYSWFGFMLGCLSLFATRYTWLRDEWISEYLLSLFSAMAAFLLRFSLAYRTYLEKKGRMRAKRQASKG